MEKSKSRKVNLKIIIPEYEYEEKVIRNKIPKPRLIIPKISNFDEIVKKNIITKEIDQNFRKGIPVLYKNSTYIFKIYYKYNFKDILMFTLHKFICDFCNSKIIININNIIEIINLTKFFTIKTKDTDYDITLDINDDEILRKEISKTVDILRQYSNLEY